MALPDYPKVMPSPFAESGNRNTIPNDSTTGFSYLQGFPPITQIPPSAGGMAPDRADFNGAFYDMSQHAYFKQSGGQYRWNAELDYPQNCFIVAADNNYYKAKQVSGPNTGAGPQNPVEDTDEEYWIAFLPGVQTELTDSVDLVSSIIAASATAVKKAYDKAVAGEFASGTRMLFQQSAAPTNWVKETNIAYNDAALRFVTGDVGTANSLGFSSVFASRSFAVSGSVSAATLSVAQLAAHTHTVAVGGNTSCGNYSSRTVIAAGSTASGSAGSNSSHTHSFSSGSTTINLAVKRVDVIICTKS